MGALAPAADPPRIVPASARAVLVEEPSHELARSVPSARQVPHQLVKLPAGCTVQRFGAKRHVSLAALFGAFARSFTLPAAIDQERIRADYKDGILKVVMPKREEIKPKQIRVSVT
jgi:hypothetical protein